MSSRFFGVLLLCLGLAQAPAAFAVDGSSLDLGYGEGTSMARVNLRWNWLKQWPVGQNWIATGFWEAGVGNWYSNRSGGKKLWEIGVTPVFRLYSKRSPFFWEGGIGVHIMSEDRVNDKRVFGNHFNFGDLVGFGWRFGQNDRYELGYRFEHLSNANTAMPNGAINFHMLRFGFNF